MNYFHLTRIFSKQKKPRLTRKLIMMREGQNFSRVKRLEILLFVTTVISLELFFYASTEESDIELVTTRAEKLLQELDNFKENYTCGDACPVEGYETRRILHCGDFVETQYFTFANGRDDWNSAICCYCCSDENILSLDQMKKKFDTGGKQPLCLCEYCSSLEIMPPTTNASMIFVEKNPKQKTKKK